MMAKVLMTKSKFQLYRTASENCSAAFSLVETVLAIGVVSFALLAVLGVMSTGSSSLRRAVDSTVYSQIVQSVLASAKQSDFSGLTNSAPVGWNGRLLYFDDRGVMLDGASNALYRATVSILSPAALPGTSSNYSDLAQISVRITKTANTNDAYKVSAIVANNGQ